MSKASAAGKAPSIKTGQRAVQSCSYCYRRKIKCSKTFPCQNCLARGISDQCHQTPVIVKGAIVGGSDDKPRSPLTPEQILAENTALRKKIGQQDKLIASFQRQLGGGAPPPLSLGGGPSSSSEWGGTPRDHLNLGIGTSGATDPAIAAATFLSQHSPPQQPSFSPQGSTASSGPTTGAADIIENGESLILGFPVSKFSFLDDNQPKATRQTIESHGITLQDLVPVAKSSLLVEAHFQYLQWVHCAVHVPSFLHEHAIWIEKLRRGEQVDPGYDFLAQYFFIIAASLYFLDAQMCAAIGYSQSEMATLPKVWVSAGLEALQRSDYMCAPTLKSLSAIAILPMVGHAADQSAYTSALLSCALTQAQTLKIHLLGPEPEDSPPEGLIEREVARRIWSCLIIGECMSSTSHQPFALLYPPSICAEPLNANDEDLSNERLTVVRPLSEPTIVTHLLAVTRTANLFRHYHHSFYRACTSIDQQFALAMSTDAELIHVLDFCPALLRNDEPYPETVEVAPGEVFDYIPWSRHLWATLMPHSRIILFKSFLSRAFSDSRYQEARTVCLESARTLMIERERPTPQTFRKTWHVSANTILCGMIIATEFLHGEHDPSDSLHLRSEVVSVIRLLERDRALDNAVTLRGVNLLRRMIGEATPAVSVAPPPLDPNKPYQPETVPPSPSALPGLEELWPLDMVGSGLGTIGLGGVHTDDWWTSGNAFGGAYDWFTAPFPFTGDQVPAVGVMPHMSQWFEGLEQGQQ